MKNIPYIPIFFLILIGLGFFSLTIIKSEGSKCIANPIKTGLEYMDKATNSNTSCTCSFSDPSYRSVIITSEGMSYLDIQNQDPNLTSFNFSLTK